MTRSKGVGCGRWDAPVGRTGSCRGVTLVELIVVVAILGVMAGTTGLALASLRPAPSAEVAAELARARAEAIRTGRPVRILGASSDSVASRSAHPTPVWAFLPDGRVVGPAIDPLTGRPHGAR